MMPTHLIIDGYNLLGVMGSTEPRAEAGGGTARDHLLLVLSSYAHRTRHRLTVVFDGWRQGASLESREQRSGVQVVYSKRGELADQVIQRLAAAGGPDCAVVSSDREVADSARAQGAFVMGAQEFAAKLRTPDRPRNRPPFAKDEDDGEGLRPPSEKKGNPRKLPKSVRQRLRRLKRF